MDILTTHQYCKTDEQPYNVLYHANIVIKTIHKYCKTDVQPCSLLCHANMDINTTNQYHTQIYNHTTFYTMLIWILIQHISTEKQIYNHMFYTMQIWTLIQHISTAIQIYNILYHANMGINIIYHTVRQKIISTLRQIVNHATFLYHTNMDINTTDQYCKADLQH